MSKHDPHTSSIQGAVYVETLMPEIAQSPQTNFKSFLQEGKTKKSKKRSFEYAKLQQLHHSKPADSHQTTHRQENNYEDSIYMQSSVIDSQHGLASIQERQPRQPKLQKQVP